MTTDFLFLQAERNQKFIFVANEDKPLVLPETVVESPLSESSHPIEIVLQLKQSLQRDRASLKDPGPDTKKLIRFMSRKAENSERLDVVNYLREITPAGTTGELVICLIYGWLRERAR